MENKYLLKQQSLRQLEKDRKVLQAVQQATAALQQAQAALLADIKFHEHLGQTGDTTQLDAEGLEELHPQAVEGPVPPWLTGRPPELQ